MKDLIETWAINNRINIYLLNAIPADHLKDISASKGRTVGEQLAHMHNVRLMWLKEAMPSQMDSVQKIEKENISKQIILEQFAKSGEAVSAMLEKAFTDGKLRGFKPHPTAFVGYIIAHEAHHRGQVVLSLKQCGHHLDKKILFGLWEWGTK